MRLVQARIGFLDDDTDRFLVEPLEAAFALEIFQVTAERAFAEEGVVLLRRDEAEAEESVGAFRADGPAFAFGKRLFEESEIRERLHGVDADAGELVAQQWVIEPAFEVMHAGVEKAFAVQADPETNGAEPG